MITAIPCRLVEHASVVGGTVAAPGPEAGPVPRPEAAASGAHGWFSCLLIRGGGGGGGSGGLGVHLVRFRTVLRVRLRRGSVPAGLLHASAPVASESRAERGGTPPLPLRTSECPRAENP